MDIEYMRNNLGMDDIQSLDNLRFKAISLILFGEIKCWLIIITDLIHNLIIYYYSNRFIIFV